MSPVVALVIDVVVVAISAYGYRLWVLTAQQEAFDPRRVLGVVRTWWRVVPLTAVQAALVVLLGIGGLFATYTAVVAAVIGLFATPAFDKGWGAAALTRTPRLRRTVRVVAALHVVCGVVLSLLGAISLLPLLVLPIVLLALRVTRPADGDGDDGNDQGDVEHEGGRLERVRRAADRPVVVDDSAVASLDHLQRSVAEAVLLAGPGGTIWTVTAGVFGLGADQASRNEELARTATDGEQMRMGIVGRTNRHALRVGAVDTTGQIELFATRREALAQVLAETGPDDVVLLAGDLPPHLP